jgi:hypothetical protein
MTGFTHHRIETLDMRRYKSGVTVTALAKRALMDRRRASVILNGPSRKELESLESALNELEDLSR